MQQRMRLATMNETGDDNRGSTLHFRAAEKQDPESEAPYIGNLTVICPTRAAVEAIGLTVGDDVDIEITPRS